MRDKESLVKVKSFASVWIDRNSETGKVTLANVSDTWYFVSNEDGQPLTPAQYQGVIDNRLSFFDVARMYRLEVVAV